jgi:ABC-type Co2+ transport system permease subunit
MYEWIYALLGFLVMFGILVGIGINQPRGTSVKMWCYGYLAISVGFDMLVILALVNTSQYIWLTNLLLGLSAGAATGLGIHVAHHISEENEQGENVKEKKPSIFGF